MLIPDSLALLGRKAVDKVTGFEGVISTIGFDVYGCVQAILTPAAKDGKLLDQGWFDVKRLTVGEVVMPNPDFGPVALGEESGGDSDKPVR